MKLFWCYVIKIRLLCNERNMDGLKVYHLNLLLPHQHQTRETNRYHLSITFSDFPFGRVEGGAHLKIRNW